jgi:hypothetical protein
MGEGAEPRAEGKQGGRPAGWREQRRGEVGGRRSGREGGGGESRGALVLVSSWVVIVTYALSTVQQQQQSLLVPSNLATNILEMCLMEKILFVIKYLNVTCSDYRDLLI